MEVKPPQYSSPLVLRRIKADWHVRAHYQPPPRPYSQHLHLALSLCSDLRLDSPRPSDLWDIRDDADREPFFEPPNRSVEEMRAVIGTYCLASGYETQL